MRSFEAERAGILAAETQAALQQAREEVELQRQRGEVVRAEFTKLEADTARRVAQLEAELQAEVRARDGAAPRSMTPPRRCSGSACPPTRSWRWSWTQRSFALGAQVRAAP